MDIRELIEKGLRRRGYDGLVNEELECSCRLGDLIPCGLDCMSSDCEAAQVTPCDCPVDEDAGSPDHDYHMTPSEGEFPTVVCLCGSTRFKDEFVKAGFRETLAGHIVLTIGCDLRTDDELFGSMTEAARQDVKRRLDELHLRKIDLADEVLILNVGGYIGESTRRELEYARAQRKPVRFLEPERTDEQSAQSVKSADKE